MNETIKIKDASPLVQSVIALDAYFSELTRVGTKLNEMTLKSESQFDMARKLLAIFAESGEKMTEEVRRLATQLQDVQARASAISELVTERADLVALRNNDQNTKIEQFRQLGEKVRSFNTALSTLRQPEGTELTNDDKKMISDRLVEFDSQLDPLIDEARELRSYAVTARMKTLEQNADSLAQTLQAVRSKIRSLRLQ